MTARIRKAVLHKGNNRQVEALPVCETHLRNRLETSEFTFIIYPSGVSHEPQLNGSHFAALLTCIRRKPNRSFKNTTSALVSHTVVQRDECAPQTTRPRCRATHIPAELRPPPHPKLFAIVPLVMRSRSSILTSTKVTSST